MEIESKSGEVRGAQLKYIELDNLVFYQLDIETVAGLVSSIFHMTYVTFKMSLFVVLILVIRRYEKGCFLEVIKRVYSLSLNSAIFYPSKLKTKYILVKYLGTRWNVTYSYVFRTHVTTETILFKYSLIYL